ncbi:hypothetical protein BH09SUM1_BH09SUM1_29700 [soil metagenome]
MSLLDRYVDGWRRWTRLSLRERSLPVFAGVVLGFSLLAILSCFPRPYSAGRRLLDEVDYDSRGYSKFASLSIEERLDFIRNEIPAHGNMQSAMLMLNGIAYEDIRESEIRMRYRNAKGEFIGPPSPLTWTLLDHGAALKSAYEHVLNAFPDKSTYGDQAFVLPFCLTPQNADLILSKVDFTAFRDEEKRIRSLASATAEAGK